VSRRRWACLVVSLVLTVGLLHTPPPAAAAAGPAAVPTAGPALGSAAAPMSPAQLTDMWSTYGDQGGHWTGGIARVSTDRWMP
jgi:hypothetical protein